MTHFYPDMDPETASLRLDRDTGLVWRKVGDGLEACGFIGDDDNCPIGLEAEWAILREWWRESGAYTEACVATAEAAWWGRFSGAAFGG